VTLYKGGLWHELEAVARPSLEEMMLFIAVVELLTLLGRHVCTASNDTDRLLIVAEGATIQSVSRNGNVSTLQMPPSGAPVFVAVDVLAVEKRIFWSDARSKTISTNYVNGTGSKVIVQKLSNPDGLAVDWMARLVFFTDAVLDAIGVTDFEGRHVILLREDLDQPRAIALDPAEGYMYWTDWGATPKVERAYMSGRARETLAETGHNTWPNGLALDLIGKRLYWADAQGNRIETCHLDGKSRQVVMQESRNIHPFGLAHVSSELYWSDWIDNSLYRTSTKTGVNEQVAKFNSRPYGVAVWKTSQQTGSNFCSKDNGGCEQLCLAEPSAAICACAVGLLQADNKTCRAPERYLLVVDPGKIRGLFADMKTGYSLMDAIRPIEALTGAVAVEFDSKTEKVFYADLGTRAIVQVTADGGQKVIMDGFSVLASIAFDWTTGNLYFVDSGRDEIGVVAVNRPLSKILISNSLDEPKGIVLDPKQGMMYWTDAGSTPKIEQSDMSGASRRTLIDTGLGQPNGITLDRVKQVIYWADALYNKVESCKTDGTSRSILLNTPSVQPFQVVLSNDQLYWTDQSQKTIMAFDLIYRNYTSMTVQFPPLTRPTGLVQRDPSLRNGTSSCSVNNGECKQLCLPVPSGRRCACMSNQSWDCLPKFVSHVTSVKAWEGTNTALPCLVTDAATSGLLLVQVDWFKDGLHIRNFTGDELASGNFPLAIGNVTLQDMGQYVCRVTNYYGSVHTNVSLAVTLGTRPTRMTTTTDTSVGSHTSELTSKGTTQGTGPTTETVTTAAPMGRHITMSMPLTKRTTEGTVKVATRMRVHAGHSCFERSYLE
jgi:low density lipoprotein receptor-related protein 5/6